ncbi:MAG: AEC family transporter [Candidatus Thiodiazotropha sp. (ex Monitilora ramsayi)]|nr:AEC family transporter [Candidatus Thiodiazotropha sp. (ex Monitilora ramsayi)]
MSLILIGLVIKQSQFISDTGWSGMERLTYYLLFPALLIHTLGRQQLEGIPWDGILIVVVVVLTVSSLILILWYRLLSSSSGPTFTSIFQGGIRFNTYIALALAQALYGEQGLAMGAVAAGFMIVLINLLCISILSIWGEGKQRNVKGFAREIIGNPLIIACAIGWTLNVTGIGLPGPSNETLEIIGRAALPFGLLAVGAALKPRAIPGHLSPSLTSALIQFILKPLLTYAMLSLTGISGVAASVLIIAFMVPTAPSAYILARQLGGDAETMASIITLQTLLAFLVMPLIAYLLLS